MLCLNATIVANQFCTMHTHKPPIFFHHLQCTDSASDSQLPTVQYNFRPIADLESVEPNQLVGKYIYILDFVKVDSDVRNYAASNHTH